MSRNKLIGKSTTTGGPSYSPSYPLVTSTNPNYRRQGIMSFTYRCSCDCVGHIPRKVGTKELICRVEGIMRPAMDRKIFSAFAPAKHHQRANMNESFKRGLRNALTGL